MIVHVLACDYDGTIAEHGHVSRETAAALARVRESGRKLLLVTGRMLPDLRRVCPDVDAMFDAVVAENGAVLYLPARREVRVLGDAPEPALVDGLRRRDVPIDIGSSVVATLAPFAESALAAIRDAGVERTLVFNKSALMLLPGGVTKDTGLGAALATLGYSRHNVVGIGDAENDHAFLAGSEMAVAVADAVPALRERADYVTPEPGPRGVVEFIGQHLLEDLAGLVPRLARHDLLVGEAPDTSPVRLAAHRTQLLVVGPSGSGKSTLTGVLVERLVETGRTVCLIDPEGDYQSLSDLDGMLVLGGKAEHALPAADELAQILRRPRSSLVLNLSAMSRAEKVDYGAMALATVSAARSSSGMPHWLVVDEAHHLFPADGSRASDGVSAGREPICLITLTLDDLAREVRTLPTAVASTDLEAFNATLRALAREGAGRAAPAPLAGAPLDHGEAALAWLDGATPRATRFRVARRRVEHRRHVRKYTEGELPAERSFYFRGPAGALNLRAANLERFCELADGVDLVTWTHHLRRGDYARWVHDVIKDPELAAEIAHVERDAAQGGDGSRRAVLAAIRRRYAV